MDTDTKNALKVILLKVRQGGFITPAIYAIEELFYADTKTRKAGNRTNKEPAGR